MHHGHSRCQAPRHRLSRCRAPCTCAATRLAFALRRRAPCCRLAPPSALGTRASSTLRAAERFPPWSSRLKGLLRNTRRVAFIRKRKNICISLYIYRRVPLIALGCTKYLWILDIRSSSVAILAQDLPWSTPTHPRCGLLWVLGRRRFHRLARLPSGLRPWACLPFLCCQAPRPLALPSASPSPLALPSALHMRCYAPRLRLAPPSAVPSPCAAERFVPRASLPLRAAERCPPWSFRLKGWLRTTRRVAFIRKIKKICISTYIFRRVPYIVLGCTKYLWH
jgi:hypothetical protein